MRRIAVSTLLVLLLAPGCGDDLPEGHFRCGTAGSCEIGKEVCVDADGCTTCLPAPAACDEAESCACLADSTDETVMQCLDSGTCEDDGDGVQLVCNADEDPPFVCG